LKEARRSLKRDDRKEEPILNYRRNEITSQEQVCQWEQTVSSHLPQLSKPHVSVLACWSFALVLLKSVGMTQVSVWLALMLGGKGGAWRQKLREGCYEAVEKKGEKRAHLQGSLCFAPLVAWIVNWWQSQQQHLVLVLDARARGANFTLLSVSVVERGGAIAVAWHLWPTGAAGAWEPLWEEMLAQGAPAIAGSWQVLVMADRGLSSRDPSEAICRQEWHPFLRLNLQGTAKQAGRDDYQPLRSFLPADGPVWRGRVSCLQSERQLSQTSLLAVHVPGSPDRWVGVTDLEPQQARLAWYGMRFWIEVGFKQGKRGGWQWQHSQMTDPRPAQVSPFTLGRLWLMRSIVEQEPLGAGHLTPSPWPQDLPTFPHRRRDVRFIHTPGVSGGFEVRLASFLQFWSVVLNPAVDGGMVHRESPFPHHFLEIAVAQRVAQVPPHAEQNDLSFVMTPFERVRLVQEKTSSVVLE
jgi:hypothetical protein